MSNSSDSGISSLSDLSTYHVGALESAAHRALRQYKDGILSKWDITGIEWYLIGTVADSGKSGMRITDLAKQLGTTLGFMTKTVNMLEAKGILHRKANANDARSNYVVLNTKYRKTYQEIETNLRNELRASIYSLVTPEELLNYIKVMDKFSRIK